MSLTRSTQIRKTTGIPLRMWPSLLALCLSTHIHVSLTTLWHFLNTMNSLSLHSHLDLGPETQTNRLSCYFPLATSFLKHFFPFCWIISDCCFLVSQALSCLCDLRSRIMPKGKREWRTWCSVNLWPDRWHVTASSSTSSQVEQQRVKGRGKVEWNTGEGEMSAHAVGIS